MKLKIAASPSSRTSTRSGGLPWRTAFSAAVRRLMAALGQLSE
jgi:hypothetical protein